MRNFIYFVFTLALASCIFSSAAKAQSIDLDKKLGKEYSKKITSEMGLYQHDPANQFVKDIGDSLIRNLNYRQFNYNFEIVEMSDPNAFALPGGYIYISRGLLPMLNSEDELAGIMGHEIVHSELRHSVQQMKSSIIPGLIQIPGQIVGMVVNEDLGELINKPITAGNKLFLATYSRKHEKEADTYGLKLMAKTGYDPTHFPQVLDNLTHLIEVMTGRKEEFSYFDSHPYTPKRISYLNDEVEKNTFSQKPNISVDQEDFLSRLDGICYGENPAHGIFQQNNFLHPDLNLFISFPEGWATENLPTVVGAADTLNQHNMVVLGIPEKNTMPEELGKEFLGNLKKSSKVIPDRAEKLNLNGMPAYLVSLTDSSGGKKIGIHSLWFRLNDITFRLLGFAEEDQFELLRNTAISIRTLKEAERNSIEKLTIRIRKAQDGESLDQFNKRTGNVWNVDMTSAMNNIKPDAELQEGQLIKIVLNEPYTKK